MLLHALVEAAPVGTTIEIGSIKEIPLYDGDVEDASGLPRSVQLLKTKIASCDGLLLVTPEYNNSIPGVFKNAIDWLTRPAGDIARVFGGRPVGLAGATPGPGATSMSQASWLPVLRLLGTLPWFGGRLAIANAGKVFDDQGKLVDPVVRAQVEKYITGFSQFVAKHRA
ncbi:MAG: NADPH-dependent reductase [Deltaproteobacteria bacterium]|nr:NADPH-dependent reductase [Deltaproteobacteria bacterium]